MIYLKRIIAPISLILILSLTSCSTIFMGPNQYIEFESDPPGATVYVDGKGVGMTPCEYNVDKGNDSEVLFMKKGYKTQKFMLSRDYTHWTTFLNIFFIVSSPFYLVDAATDSYSIYLDEDIYVKMYEVPENLPKSLKINSIILDESGIENIKSSVSSVSFSSDFVKEKIKSELDSLGINYSANAAYTLKAEFQDLQKILYNESWDTFSSKTNVVIDWSIEKNGTNLVSGTGEGFGNWPSQGSSSTEVAIINSLYDFLSKADLSNL